MNRFLAVGALVAVSVAILWILVSSEGKDPVRVVAPPLAPVVPSPQATTVSAPPSRTVVTNSADGGGYFNPNCPAGTHWVMAGQECVAWAP